MSLVWAIVIGAAAVAALTVSILVAYSPAVLNTDGTPEQTDGDEKSTTIDVESSKSNPYVLEYSFPKDTWPNAILVDSRGTIWTVGAKSGSLIAFDPAMSKAKSYAIPSRSGSQFVMTWAIAEDRDGSILFSGSGGVPLWRFHPEIEQFEPIGSPSGSPIQIKLDDEGRIWYSLLSSGIVGVVQNEKSDYEATEFDVGKESFPSGIVVRNDTLWVTKVFDGQVSQFHISSEDRKVTDLTEVEKFPRQTLVSPNDILVIDGSAWITEHGTSFITRFDMAKHQVTRYPTSLHPIHVVTLPYWLEPSGTEGIWFNEHRGNRIAFFDFSDDTLTEYEIPTRNPEAGYIANALTIHADPHDPNRLWFTEFTEDKIGYVNRSVPIPFDLRTPQTKVTLDQGGSAKINLEIVRKAGVPLFNETLSFNTSSSTITSGVLVNATAVFSPNMVDLSEVKGTQNATLELHDEGLGKGIHMLAISATDGAVGRTVYVELAVE